MTSDVPVQISLFPDSTDVETSHWGLLASELWHAGLIWPQYKQVVFPTSPPQLRVWCTFTDRHSFETWRTHPTIRERCAELLETRIEVVEVVTPWARHDAACECASSAALAIMGHGGGFRKAIVYCVDCVGYIPNHRLKVLADANYGALLTWGRAYGHVHSLWMLTAELEQCASRELQTFDSELNVSGRNHAARLSENTNKPVWYSHFLERDARSHCPGCGSEPKTAPGSIKRLACPDCLLLF